MWNRIIILAAVTVALLAFLGALTRIVSHTSNPLNVRCVGDIPAPVGFVRTQRGDPSYNEFLRGLRLKKRGSKVQLYTGGNARLQFLSAGVIEMPLLSNDEQCADITMRLRAEYLWQSGHYREIRFTSVGGNPMQYEGWDQRKSFEKYMRTVYGACNTSSVYRETSPRPFRDIQPGDVLVYPSRRKGSYGHAVLIADVAHGRNGKTAILCIEGNTPAREAHVVRNPNPLLFSWHIIREGEDVQVSVFRFHPEEIRYYK